MACIFVLSSQSKLPSAPPGLPQELFLKAGHVLGYAVLARLYEYALGPAPYARLLALVLAVLYGISDEYHQAWTPGRTPDVGDLLADTGGAIAGLWLLRPRYWRKSSKFT